MFLAPLAAAIAAGHTICYAELVLFDFTTGMFGLHNGRGPLTVDGVPYLGAGELLSISVQRSPESDGADKIEFGLSGVTPTLVAAANDYTKCNGRDVVHYGCFFTPDGDPLTGKFLFEEAIMGKPRFQITGQASRGIVLPAETIWTNRQTAAYAWFSDIDQKARFPLPVPDTFMRFISTLVYQKEPLSWR